MSSTEQLITYFRLSEKERRGKYAEGSLGELLQKRHIAVGYAHVAFLNDDGTVTAHGDNSKRQCEVSQWRDIVRVAAGDFHTAALLHNGTVVAAGDNTYGQCEVSRWRDIVQLYAERGLTVGVDSDGALHYSGRAQTAAAQAPISQAKPAAVSPSAASTSQASAPRHAAADTTEQRRRELISLAVTAPLKAALKSFTWNEMLGGGIRISKYNGNSLRVSIPQGVKSIGVRTFYGNTRLCSIDIPDGVSIIGSQAFANCPNLIQITIPSSVTQIGEHIVDMNTMLICKRGSYAEQYARKYSLRFNVIN